MSDVRVREITAADHEAWTRLFRGYRDFYGKPHDAAVFETVWGWLMDPQYGTRALIAELDGIGVGLAHFRSFDRTIEGNHALYLDDLFTEAAARGRGAASALLDELSRIASDEGAAFVRWITDEDNSTARRLYDSVAKQTAWVTYDLPPAPALSPVVAERTRDE